MSDSFVASSTSNLITVHINGNPCTYSSQISLPNLLKQLGLDSRLIAVEYNGEILHRQFWAETIIQAGDCLEIVTIVGGG